MEPTLSRSLLSVAAGLMALCLALPACAQYIWLDKNNIKNYSDKPPPPSVPQSRILKTPRAKTISAATDVPSANGVSASAAQQKPATADDKNAADKKRKEEQAAKDKKAADEAKQAEVKAKNCERAREYQRTLSSGQRLIRADKKGERSFLSDEQRAQEQQEVNRVLEGCK